ncbi:MAG TPA: lysophospholipid acyltransferase family protein [Methylomirabilota bacterium]|nr:lysophospholipid acyltransferase family protein [Methylomirabilota bacterium]
MGRRRPASWWVGGAQRALAWVVGVAVQGAARLPPSMARSLGAGLGTLAYWALSGRRRIALANLALAFGARLDARERAALARANFRHLGITALECCRLFVGAADVLLGRVEVEGVEHVWAARAQGRGLFFLTAHFGNWELLAAAHRLVGGGLNVVVRPLDNPFLEALLARGRQRSGVRLIPKRAAVPGVRAALARGDCVGILLDQDGGPGGVAVPFFDRSASTSRSLAVLALKTGAPVIPAFIRRLPTGGHRITLEPMIPLSGSGDRAADVAAATARFTAVIERHVRAHPDQWFWVHRRWKTAAP